jgi:hypothetical protein
MLLAGLAAAAGLAGCVRHPTCDPAFGRPATMATLYFGASLPGGGTVSDAQWRQFLAGTVTPAFPDGLTVTEGSGQWRDPETHSIAAEHTRIVTVVTFGDPMLAASLAHVRAAYRTRFRQESVGLTVAPACADF